MTMLRLALRDLRGGLSGLGLLALCLAIAVAGIAAVTSLAAASDRAIAANGRALLGGDLLLRVSQRDATSEERAALAAMGTLTRSVGSRASIVTADGRSQLAELTAAGPDWPLAGAVEMAQGRRPRGLEIAVGRDLAERLALRVGDRVRVGETELAISGIISRLPAGGGFSLAPPALIDDEALAATRLVQPGSLTSTAYRLRLAPGTRPDAAARGFLARFPDGGWQATTRDEAGGGTRRFIDRVGQLLLLVALAALGIGGLGIASAADAFAASRRRTVAILKTVGATPRQVIAMLGVEVVVLAGLALAAGLAVGAVTPWLAHEAAERWALPVVPAPDVAWGALGRSAVFGLLVTLAACWRPLASALATRPAPLLRGAVGEAPPGAIGGRAVPALFLLAAAGFAVATASEPTFMAASVAALALIAALFAAMGAGLRRAARRWRHRGGPVVRLGVAALDRPGAPTQRLAVALGVGLSLLVALAAIASSLLGEIDRTVPRRAPALFLVDIPASEARRFEALVETNLPGAGLIMVPSLRGPVVALNGRRVSEMKTIPEGAWVLRGDRGLTFLRDLPAGNRLTAGRWWPRDYRGPPLVSLDADAAEALGLKVGDRLTIAVLGRPIEARIASLREIDWRSFGFNFAIIFAPGTLEQAPYTMMATVRPADDAPVARLERALAREFPMVSAIRTADIVSEVRRLLESLEAAVRLATGFAIAMGMIVLAGAVVASRRERQRDLVLLRLVGATRGAAARTQLVEFSLLAGSTALVALTVGAGLAWALLRFWFEVPFQPDGATLLFIPLAAILLAVAAALWAAWPAIQAKPAAALRAL